jgi:hypothetical protein
MKKSSYTLHELTERIVQDYKDYEKTGTTPWDYKIAAQDLTYQIGSLNKLLMQLHGDRYAKGLSKTQIMTQIADELADIMTDTLFAAHCLNIDMDQAFDKMIESDQKKIAERSAINC